MDNKIIGRLLAGLEGTIYDECQNNERYVQLSEDISDLLNGCENVRKIVEYNHVIALSEEDCKVLIK